MRTHPLSPSFKHPEVNPNRGVSSEPLPRRGSEARRGLGNGCSALVPNPAQDILGYISIFKYICIHTYVAICIHIYYLYIYRMALILILNFTCAWTFTFVAIGAFMVICRFMCTFIHAHIHVCTCTLNLKLSFSCMYMPIHVYVHSCSYPCLYLYPRIEAVFLLYVYITLICYYTCIYVHYFLSVALYVHSSGSDAAKPGRF